MRLLNDFGIPQLHSAKTDLEWKDAQGTLQHGTNGLEILVSRTTVCHPAAESPACKDHGWAYRGRTVENCAVDERLPV